MNEDARLVLVRPGGWDWLRPETRSVRRAPRAGRRSGSRRPWPTRAPRSPTSTASTRPWPRSDGGEATAAVLIRPVSVEEIRRTAEEGLLMPPKSTYFTPKLRTGLVIRDLGTG